MPRRNTSASIPQRLLYIKPHITQFESGYIHSVSVFRFHLEASRQVSWFNVLSGQCVGYFGHVITARESFV